MWFCVFPSTDSRKPDREMAERTRSTVWLLKSVQSSTVFGFAHSPMEVNPSLAAKSMFASLKFPSMPSFGCHVLGLAMAAAARPLMIVRLVMLEIHSEAELYFARIARAGDASVIAASERGADAAPVGVIEDVVEFAGEFQLDLLANREL